MEGGRGALRTQQRELKDRGVSTSHPVKRAAFKLGAIPFFLSLFLCSTFRIQWPRFRDRLHRPKSPVDAVAPDARGRQGRDRGGRGVTTAVVAEQGPRERGEIGVARPRRKVDGGARWPMVAIRHDLRVEGPSSVEMETATTIVALGQDDGDAAARASVT